MPVHERKEAIHTSESDMYPASVPGGKEQRDTGGNVRPVLLPVPPEVPARRERPVIRSGDPLLQEKAIAMRRL
jgi:hypothetical protein